MKNFWNNLKPINRGLVIFGVVAIIIAAMITGNFDTIIGLFK